MNAWLTTSEASTALGVSQRQVQRLVTQGVLPARTTRGGRRLIDPLGVQLHAEGQRGPGRRWTEQTAWRVLWRLSYPDKTGWAAPSEVARIDELVRQALRNPDPETDDPARPGYGAAREIVSKSSTRAKSYTFSVEPELVPAVRDAVVPSGPSSVESVPGAGLEPDPDKVCGYVTPQRASQLVKSCEMRWDLSGNVMLRITGYTTTLAHWAPTGKAIVAADLAASVRPSERNEGFRFLQKYIEELADGGYATAARRGVRGG